MAVGCSQEVLEIIFPADLQECVLLHIRLEDQDLVRSQVHFCELDQAHGLVVLEPLNQGGHLVENVERVIPFFQLLDEVNFETGERVVTDNVTLHGVPFAALAPDEHYKYLGVWATVTGDFSAEKQYVLD